MVAAAAVVTSDVPDHALMVGNPARLRGWVCCCGAKLPAFLKDRADCSCGRSWQLKTPRDLVEILESPADCV